MNKTADFERVWLDTSPFARFADVELCEKLRIYLDDKLRITVDVETELKRAPQPQIKLLSLVQNWPPGGAYALPQPLNDEARRIIELSHEEGDPPDKNAGEVTTVLAAQEDGCNLAILEDDFGKRLCRRRGVPRLSTAQLAAEMVATGAFTEEEGYAVWETTVGDPANLKYWKPTLREARRAQQA